MTTCFVVRLTKFIFFVVTSSRDRYSVIRANHKNKMGSNTSKKILVMHSSFRLTRTMIIEEVKMAKCTLRNVKLMIARDKYAK